jgi:hypothetical protein
MQALQDNYNNLCNSPSDINEHLPILFNYAYQCNNAIESGVRGCVSSFAIAYGLLSNPNNTNPLLVVNDIQTCDIGPLMNATHLLPIQYKSLWMNNLDIDLVNDLDNQTFDMIFIDTWHVYGQLKRELDKFSPIINKYIIMHDTTIDEIDGETIRNNWDANAQSIQYNIPVDEINKGLSYAIDEFLQANTQWVLKEKLTNNNGLTVLEKITN